MGAGLRAALASFDTLLAGKVPARVEGTFDDPDEAALVLRVNRLADLVAETLAFVEPLARGELDQKAPRAANFLASPFKELQANLLHVAWQVSRVAEGDYSQRVDFLGEFATSINRMVEALAEKDRALQRNLDHLRASSEELRRLATTDELTGAANRRYFFDRAAEEIERARRYERPLCLFMLDLDHFKHVNDTYGHPAGDAVLIALADQCRLVLRTQDVFGRVGGEEFAVLAPETSLDIASLVAERLRARVAAMRVPFTTIEVSITVSLGVAGLRFEGDSLTELIHRADAALYRAKGNGRDRIEIAD